MLQWDPTAGEGGNGDWVEIFSFCPEGCHCGPGPSPPEPEEECGVGRICMALVSCANRKKGGTPPVIKIRYAAAEFEVQPCPLH